MFASSKVSPCEHIKTPKLWPNHFERNWPSDRLIFHTASALNLSQDKFGARNWNTFSALIERHPVRALQLPEGWTIAGSTPQHYNMGVDACRRRGSAVIECKFPADDPRSIELEKGFGTLMQSIVADPYRGKIIRLAAKLKAEMVSGAGTLWMRVEKEPNQILRFDNMENRQSSGPVCGNADWTYREIVLDIPEEAMSIHYGFYLRGTGTLQVCDLALEEAAADAKITAARHRFLERPTNLGLSLG